MKNSLSYRQTQLVLSVTFLVVYAIGAYFVDKSDTVTHWWSDMFWTVAALLAGLRCIATARGEEQNIRQAWMFIGFACLSWFAGMLVWDYLELFANQPVPFPGIPDLGFILFAPLLMAGIIAYRSEIKSVQLTLKQISELGLILSAIVITITIILYKPIQELQESLMYLITALSYPVLYMGAFFFGLTTPFIRPSREKRHVMTLLLIGIGIHAGADTIYAYALLGKSYAVGDYLDFLWLLGFVVIYWAGFEQSISKKSALYEETITTEIYSQKIEAILPAIILLWIGLVFIVFGRDIDAELLLYLSPAGFMVALFLATLGWSEHKIQDKLYRELLDSKKSLISSYAELEERVKERTNELNLAKDAAEQASKVKSKFLSSMSHELRTPMNGILGFAQIIKLDEDKLSDVNRRNVDEILNAGEHLMSLINEVLDLQSIEAGKLKLDIESIEMESIIDECIHIIAPVAKEKGIKLEARVCRTGTSVLADHMKLKQALINLISNAIKYNTEGGHVLVECDDHSENEIIINVVDDGFGILEDEQKYIFSPFVRVGKNNVEGTGIGLTITKEIIEALGGRVEISSEPGKGTTFSLYLQKPSG